MAPEEKKRPIFGIFASAVALDSEEREKVSTISSSSTSGVSSLDEELPRKERPNFQKESVKAENESFFEFQPGPNDVSSGLAVGEEEENSPEASDSSFVKAEEDGNLDNLITEVEDQVRQIGETIEKLSDRRNSTQITTEEEGQSPNNFEAFNGSKDQLERWSMDCEPEPEPEDLEPESPEPPTFPRPNELESSDFKASTMMKNDQDLNKTILDSDASTEDKTILDMEQPDQLNTLRTKTSVTLDARRDDENVMNGIVTGQRKAIRDLIIKALEEAKKGGPTTTRPVYVHLQHQVHVEIVNNPKEEDEANLNESDDNVRLCCIKA